MYSWFGNSSGSRKRCQFIHGGQANGKGRALPAGVIRTKNFAAVFFHDSVTDAEAEAGPFSDLLGGEKRIEDAVRIGDAMAVVAECDFDIVLVAARGNIDARAVEGLTDGGIGVVAECETHML